MSSFPNASAGIQKVFKAEILNLISLLVAVLGTIFVVCSIGARSMGGIITLSVIGILLMLGSLALTVFSFVNFLIGLKRASADEDSFRKALLCCIASVAVQVVAVILSCFIRSSNTGNDIANVLSRVADLGCTFFTITGCTFLLTKRGKNSLSNSGSNTMLMILVLFGISIVFRIVPIFILSPIPKIIFLILYAIASLVAYVKYLSFLRDACGNLK